MRPRTLAAVFGIYFLIIAYVAWTFANGQSSKWYLPDITRWIYTTYMLVAAIFLVGLGGMGISVRRSFAKQIRQLEARLAGGSPGAMSDALPPPLPDNTTTSKDHVDRDIDELLQSLSEVEASAAKEASAIEAESEGVSEAALGVQDSELAAKKKRLEQRQKFLGRFVAGPGLVAAFVLGISSIMLLGSDGFDQTNFALNTAVILGIGYGWLGIGGYIAATVAALVSAKDGRKK